MRMAGAATALFTADFLWHVALTSELAKEASPPSKSLRSTPTALLLGLLRSPRSRRPSLPLQANTKSLLLINAFCAGLLFVAAIFILAWCVVPRAGPVAVAVACVVLAASAEGAYALWDFWLRGRPLSGACELNIDAITAWWFQTLTIDSLPRSLWYATTCNGLRILMVALILPVRGGTNVRYPAPRRRPRARTGGDLQPISRRRLCADLQVSPRLGFNAARSVMLLMRYAPRSFRWLPGPRLVYCRRRSRRIGRRRTGALAQRVRRSSGARGSCAGSRARRRDPGCRLGRVAPLALATHRSRERDGIFMRTS